MSEFDDIIVYALIAKKEKPLVEYSNYVGTFNTLCINYLKKIVDNTSKAAKVDDLVLYYINENSLTFMVLTGKSYPKATAIGFLDSIQKEFLNTYPGRDFDGELNFGLKDEFQPKLKLKFDYFNENKDVSDDKIGRLKEQMISMNEEILNTSGLLDERSSKIQILDKKADELTDNSRTYYRQSKRVKNAERWKKIKLYIALGVAGIIIIYFIISFICGFDFSKCKSDK